jgi:hypothetical protein
MKTRCALPSTASSRALASSTSGQRREKRKTAQHSVPPAPARVGDVEDATRSTGGDPNSGVLIEFIAAAALGGHSGAFLRAGRGGGAGLGTLLAVLRRLLMLFPIELTHDGGL